MKKCLETSSFYTSVTKIMMCYAVSEMWHVTDVIIFHFRVFFASGSLDAPCKMMPLFYFAIFVFENENVRNCKSLFQQIFVYQTLTAGIKTENLSRKTRFGLRLFYKGFL